MRHLKKFNESKETPTSIEDILLDITDLGYLSRIEHIFWTKVEGDSGRNDVCLLAIYDKKSNDYKGMMCVDEIIDTIERLVSYLESEGYNLENICQQKLESIRQTSEKDANGDPQKFTIEIDKYNVMVFFTKNGKWYINSTSISFEFRK
jgi:hypothetical protein